MDKISSIEHIMRIKERFKVTLVDAIVMYCEEANIDIEDFSDSIKKETEFIEKIKVEAIENRLLRKSDGWVKKASLKKFF